MHAGRPTDKQTDRQTDRQTDGQTDMYSRMCEEKASELGNLRRRKRLLRPGGSIFGCGVQESGHQDEYFNYACPQVFVKGLQSNSSNMFLG